MRGDLRRGWVAALAAAGLCAGVHATPGELDEPTPRAVDVMFVFSHLPDAHGRFEVEVYCHVREELRDLRIELSSEGDVELERAPSYAGPVEAGRTFVWRIRGRHGAPEDGFPPVLGLAVDYEFPYSRMVRTLLHRPREGMDAAAKASMLRALRERRGETVTILRSLVLHPRRGRGAR